MRVISRNGLSILVVAIFGLLLGCGGGRGGSDPDPAVRITIDGPEVVNSFFDCNGRSWGECVRLSAVFETAGGARLSSARWDFADYCPGFSQECVSYYTDGEDLTALELISHIDAPTHSRCRETDYLKVILVERVIDCDTNPKTMIDIVRQSNV